MLEMTIQVFSTGHEPAQLGESCCWDPQRNALWWVDIGGKRLLKTDAATGVTQSWPTPELPGFVALTASDAAVVGMETGIFRFDPVAGTFDRILDLAQPASRFNDAIVDAQGRLWASTMPLDGAAGGGAIYRVTDSLELVPIVRGLTTPNGIAVDFARRRFIYSDSHPDLQRIWTLPLGADDLPVDPATDFASTSALRGRPDGASLDDAGFYWIAGVDGSELYVFDLDGALHATVPVPFPAPTKVSFFGHDGRSVAVTSKDHGENGGYLAAGRLSQDVPAGAVQPYWVTRS